MKHKRIITIIFALAALCGGAWAQQKQGHVMRPKPRGGGNTTVVGQAQLEVEYALNATDLRNPDTYIDLHVLQAGQRLSKHYSRFMEQGDSLYDAYMKANPHAEGVPTSLYTIGREGQYWSEYQSTEIFTEQGQQTLYAWMPWAMERYNAYYTEPAAQQKWTLHPERTTLLGHSCQRATCHWRGRNFEAWFDDLQTQMEGDVATTLQNQINELKEGAHKTYTGANAPTSGLGEDGDTYVKTR